MYNYIAYNRFYKCRFLHLFNLMCQVSCRSTSLMESSLASASAALTVMITRLFTNCRGQEKNDSLVLARQCRPLVRRSVVCRQVHRTRMTLAQQVLSHLQHRLYPVL